MEEKRTPNTRRILPILLGLLFVVFLLSLFFTRSGDMELSPVEFEQAVREGKVEAIAFELKDNLYKGKGILSEPFKIETPETAQQTVPEAAQNEEIKTEPLDVDQDTAFSSTPIFFKVILPQLDRETQELLNEKGVVWGMHINSPSFLSKYWLLIVMVIFAVFMLRSLRRSVNNDVGSQMQNLTGNVGRRALVGKKPVETLMDVAGHDEAKVEVVEIIHFLRFPEKFRALGARIPKGILMVGPPGTGKTLMARAIAGEAQVPFFSISGSQFVELYVGMGAARVRDLFGEAKKSAPSIVFIDELDAIGRQRGTGLGGGHDEREQTLNQILVEMDGFNNHTNVIVIAATNRPDILDAALLRPGRFDRQVVLDALDFKGREEVLAVHAKGKPFAEGVDFKKISQQIPGFSGADIENLLNEAAILAVRKDAGVITSQDIEEAIDKVIAGPERKSRVISENEKKIVAYHEAGHALVASRIQGHDPVHKITIVPRGMSAGYTRYLPEEEQHLKPKSYYEGFLASALAGHVAEELIFGEMTTGAHDDIRQATAIARNMVTQWGMSKKLGARTFGDRQSPIFLGRTISEQQDYSDETAKNIDDEIRELIDHAQDKARSILRENRVQLDIVAKALQEKETLTGEELKHLLYSDAHGDD